MAHIEEMSSFRNEVHAVKGPLAAPIEVMKPLLETLILYRVVNYIHLTFLLCHRL